jgi:ubiquinone/menaquinone biosynthesis C-methylase UbiE
MIAKLVKWTLIIGAVSSAWLWLPILLLTSPVWMITLIFWYSFIKVFRLEDSLQLGLMWALHLVFLRFSWMRRFTWRTYYNLLAAQVSSPALKCLNCGFKTDDLELPVEYQEEKFSYQLYHYIATGLGSIRSLEGLHVLEVGSGRGGGLTYVTRQLKPISAVGVDMSEGQVHYSNKHCLNTNLLFVQGAAESMPVKDACVDVVICIESSLCFGNFSRFLSEVTRVLVRGGHLFFADLRYKEQIAELDGQFRATQLALVKKHDITDHVIAALQDDAERRVSVIKQVCPICEG